ncbi:serine protease inhibitor Cvsi-1-like [Ylistrum balloti]|uniref:serine protease inhibitor Cvsi-1-like n=1 Tax=Ylistrum balloti TaxID=509963 RepID=UPI002905F456|nr:serine protease inhibitor Cvsi-1-like [Ylistrum balloti]
MLFDENNGEVMSYGSHSDLTERYRNSLSNMKLDVLVLVISESCSTNNVSGCVSTTCDSVSHKACVHGICTCEVNTSHSCTSRDDCANIQSWTCSQFRRHCVNGVCHCGNI